MSAEERRSFEQVIAEEKAAKSENINRTSRQLPVGRIPWQHRISRIAKGRTCFPRSNDSGLIESCDRARVMP
jgi:hypothetical protein